MPPLTNQQVTLFAVFNGISKVKEQSSTPLIREATAPTPGNPWTWTIDPLSLGDFDSTNPPQFDFAYDNVDAFAGENFDNTDRVRARLIWTYIDDADWRKSGGLDGKVRLTLSNGLDSDIVYEDGGANGAFEISLRHLDKSGYLLLQNRNSGEEPLPVTDTDTYAFSVGPNGFTKVSGSDLPMNFSLTFSDKGAITGTDGDAPAWDEQVTFDLVVQRGAHEPCTIDDIVLKLDSSGPDTTGYAILQGFNATTDALPDAETDTFAFSVGTGGFTKVSGSDLPALFGLTFNDRGAITGLLGDTPAWDEQVTFDLVLAQGNLAGSVFSGQTLQLRAGVVIDGYLLTEGFATTSQALDGGDGNTWTFGVTSDGFTKVSGSDLPLNFGLAFSTKGAITGTVGDAPAWDEVVTFDLSVQHSTEASWAGSIYTGLDLMLRAGVVIDGYLLLENRDSVDDALVAGDTNTWTFGVTSDGFTKVSGSDLPLNFGLAFSTKGAITGTVGDAPAWDEVVTFDLSVQHSTEASWAGSIYQAINLRLVAGGIAITGYTYFNNQQSGEDALAATDTNTWTFDVTADGFTKVSGSDLPLNFGLAFSDRGAITGAVGDTPAWNEDVTFDLRISTGNSAGSIFEEIILQLRKLHPDTLPVHESWSNDSTPISVTGDTSSFSWSAFASTTLPLVAADVTGAAMTVTWNGGTLDPFVGTSADFSLTVKKGTLAWSSISHTADVTGDAAAPKPTITSAEFGSTNLNPFTVSVAYGVPVSVAEASKLVADNAALSVSSGADGDSTFTFSVAPFGSGAVALNYDVGGYYNDPALDTTDGLPNEDADEWTINYTSVFPILSKQNNQVLPSCRERMRYQTVVHFEATPSGPVTWAVNNHADIFELVDDPDTPLPANQQILRTKIGVVASDIKFIPGDWFEIGPQNVSITATTNVGTGTTDFSLPVINTAEDIDVAIVLDHSGSMRRWDRWEAAYDGAQMFCDLVDGITDDPPNNNNKVGVYWFAGNCGDRNHDHTTYPVDMYFGSFPVTPVAGGIATDFSIDTDAALTDHAQIPAIFGSVANKPTDCTGIAAGLYHCKEELTAGTLGSNGHEKVILALSDGMENCKPYLEDLIQSGGTPNWPSDAGIRIYSVAVMTSHAWVNKLRGASEATGGYGALDVKHIEQGTSADSAHNLVLKWFRGSFCNLYGYDPILDTPDPTLSGGEFDEYPISITLGVDRLVVTCLLEEDDDGKWDLGLVPPGQDCAIYFSSASLYAGVRTLSSKRYLGMVVDLPLDLDGHGHRWAGDWKVVVVRKAGAPAANYSVGAMAHQDTLNTLDIVLPSKPLPGDTAKFVLNLRGKDGKPITGATATATVYLPGPWPGHDVALEVGSNLALVKKLKQSKSMAAVDSGSVADTILGQMYSKSAFEPGPQKKLTLSHAGKGVYEAQLKLDRPGPHNIDVSVELDRKSLPGEQDLKLKTHIDRIGDIYSAVDARAEKAFVKKAAGARQAFGLELRRQLSVGFLPTVKDSQTGGYFMSGETIRLMVQPAGKGDVLLGPGWADSIQFVAPDGDVLPWPVVDQGNGDYLLDFQLDATNPRFDMGGTAIVSDRMVLRHALGADIGVADHTLPLKGFSVTVLGIKMPIEVRALLGNRRSREVHLITCQYASKIADKNKTWLHDLKQAKRLGYDTCEHCLPLICNTDPKHMEAHKLFCSHVRRIKTSNRVEVHNWSQAEKLGFDGCFHCLKDKHTR